MEKQHNANQLLVNFLIVGIIIGTFFPISSTIIHLIISKQAFTLENILNFHSEFPILWFLDMMPFIVPLIAYFIATYLNSNLKSLELVITSDRTKTLEIEKFTESIKNEDFETNFNVDTNNNLVRSLVELRKNLKNSKTEEAQRRKEDAERHWVNEGLAKFAEILRQNSDNIEILAYTVVLNLVKYTDANQGGFYLLESNEGEEKYFSLISSVAFDRRKYKKKTIEWNEGLVGRCAIEKEPIFLTDVPDNYIEVKSGLGTANPRCIYIVPLILNDEIHGVIEVAGFTVFENYKLQFINKLAESIAATIASVRINIKTSKLLEESQIQAEKLAMQEEIMRRNMEQLRITQKEAAEQAKEFVSFTNSVNHTMIRAEYSVDGILKYANTKFISKMGYTTNEDVENRHINLFISKKDQEWFARIWAALSAGGKHFENYMKHITKQGTEIWTMATYTCVRGADGSIDKILFLALDTTDEKKQSLDYEGQIEALNRSTYKGEYLPSGQILDLNKKFLNVLEYTMLELSNKSIFEFIHLDDKKQFKEIFNSVVRGTPKETIVRIVSQSNEIHWFRISLSAVNDMYGDIAKIISIGNDITEQKIAQLKEEEHTKELKLKEEALRLAKDNLQEKLNQAKAEVLEQFEEIAQVKILNEKTLEGLLDAVVTINAKNEIEFFNKAAENLWGISKQEVIGKNIETLLPSDYQDEDSNYMGNFFKAGEKSKLGQRTEVHFILNDETTSVLMTLSEAYNDDYYRLTAFIQEIEVELF